MADQASVDIVNKAFDDAGVSRDIGNRVWGAESGKATKAGSKSSTDVRGPFQITGGTWDRYMPGVPYSEDLKLQAECAAKILKAALARYDGNIEHALISYNAGDGIAGKIKGGMSIADSVASSIWDGPKKTMPKGMILVPKGRTKEQYIAEKTAEVAGYNMAVMGKPGQGAGVRTVSVAEVGNTEGVASFASPLSGGSVSESAFSKMASNPLYEPKGLTDTLGWFEDIDRSTGNPKNSTADGQLELTANTENSLVVGNSKLGSPTWFCVRLRDNWNSMYLPREENDLWGQPARINLNCSLTEMQTSFKHRITNSPTRTGIHVTLWGMEPDVVTGSGSTGAWMNQYGLTSWMSTKEEDMPDDIKDFVRDQFNREKDHRPFGREPYRVAAQDAFSELLALFKYNAITRFKDQNYSKTFTDRDQLGENLWSDQRGTSSAVASMRHGDVMYRGMVEMHTQREVYHGFFKSLSFNEDAERPFRWNFEFTFQIQKITKSLSNPVY